MLSLFFSYSHIDEKYRNELEIHLTTLKRAGVIGLWHDRRIVAGADIDKEIDLNLEKADIILMMVSANFLASDYCYEKELSRALEKHDEGTAVVIPVIVHPCDWQHSIFSNLRATPTDGQPISKYPNIHDAYLGIVEDIRKAAEKLGPITKKEMKGISSAKMKPSEPKPRSSNLRMKHEYTDKDKDDFLESTFEYIANFFENSLTELKSRNTEIDIRFTRIDKNSFTSSAYFSGKKISSCSIWKGGKPMLGGDICYSNSDSGPGNSTNDSLSVADDGIVLFLKSLGMGFAASNRGEQLSQQGGAEQFWALFIAPLQ